MVSDNAIDHGGKGKKKAAVLPEATEDEMMWINDGKEALDIVEDPSVRQRLSPFFFVKVKVTDCL